MSKNGCRKLSSSGPRRPRALLGVVQFFRGLWGQLSLASPPSAAGGRRATYRTEAARTLESGEGRLTRSPSRRGDGGGAGERHRRRHGGSAEAGVGSRGSEDRWRRVCLLPLGLREAGGQCAQLVRYEAQYIVSSL